MEAAKARLHAEAESKARKQHAEAEAAAARHVEALRAIAAKGSAEGIKVAAAATRRMILRWQRR